MTKPWWTTMTDNREALWFKPVPEGYVFRAPNPWVFGRGCFFLVDEAQKKLLAGILTAQSPSMTVVRLMAAIAFMFAGSAPIVMFLSHHGVTGASLVVAVALLAWLSLYTAMLFCMRPIALLVQRHVSDLTPTDQRITAADIRVASEKAVWLPGHLIFALSYAILSASFFMQAIQRTYGHHGSLMGNTAAFCAILSGSCFAYASVCMLVRALNAMRRRDETAPAPKTWRLPALTLALAIITLATMIMTGQ
jgi:hypothetical protein